MLAWRSVGGRRQVNWAFGFRKQRGAANVSILLASHTMPSVEEMFGPMALAASALAASLATLLAGSWGVNSVATLPWGRHMCAMGAGVAAGWAMLAALIWPAVAWFPSCSAALTVLLVGTLVGVVLARGVARRVASHLTGYRCRRCGTSFHSLAPTENCVLCTSAAETTAAAQALAEFDDRYRELRERGKPYQAGTDASGDRPRD
jgi:hypothetical protein